MRLLDYILSVLLILPFVAMTMSCGGKSASAPSHTVAADNDSDMIAIEEAGELIAVTLPGEETFRESNGRNVAIHYILCEQFANRLGVRMRMELASDTAAMVAMLRNRQADIIAFPLPEKYFSDTLIVAAGMRADVCSWAVRSSSHQLVSELNRWYGEQALASAHDEQKNGPQRRYRRLHAQSQFQSRERGVVSNYDQLFLRAARTVGWDWKLLASMCYQESSFDADAESWAGARGLMQIMPSTARGLGIDPDRLYDPETNVMAAAKLLHQTDGHFQDITNQAERRKFVLAAYNGGSGHIRDAMALARKDGRNPHLWNDVATYVLHLSDPQYYNDPVVKHGYMVGRETFNYVNAVMGRWNGYHATLHDAIPRGAAASTVASPRRSSKANKPLLRRDDSLFNIGVAR